MKAKYIIVSLLISTVFSARAQREVCYALPNEDVIFSFEWSSNNYGDIEWQKSTDSGETWTVIQGETKPRLTVKAENGVLYRSVINGDPSCPPLMEEREIKTLELSQNITDKSWNSIDIEVDASSLKGVDIVEYGYCAMITGLARNYSIIPRFKTGETLPGDSFTIKCESLDPNTPYTLRSYFKTKDGSIIFGKEVFETTEGGPRFDTKGWIIEKTSVQIPFSIPGVVRSQCEIQFLFGKDKANLQDVGFVDSRGTNFQSNLIENLTPGTQYLAVVKGTVDGAPFEIEKTVTTWSDYSSIEVDNEVKEVKHTVNWDSKNLICLTPEDLQVEYPRMCRVDENKILFTYHGGVTDHWQNSYLRKSYDNGKTWTDPVEIFKVGNQFMGSGYYRFCNPEMTKLANGWIVLTVIGNANPETNANCKVLASISKDGGETWGDPIIVGNDRTWEPQVVQLPNGELELLVSSEGAWWETQRDNLFQEIVSTRSTDNGETWTQYNRASYKPGARDGMPVAVVMQGNKGVLFVEESVNGGIPPSLQYRSLDGEWDTADWDGKEDDQRWLTKLNNGGGAPYMIQLPTGEFLIMAHTQQTGSVWQTCRPQVIMADNTGHNMKLSKHPLAGGVLPNECGAYYNSFFLYDNETVWLLFTKAQYRGGTREYSDIMIMEGKIVTSGR